MQNEQTTQDPVPADSRTDSRTDSQAGDAAHEQAGGEQATPDVDGLKDKAPEELTPEELRLMADTMPGDGPGD